jgi:putative membrane protein
MGEARREPVALAAISSASIVFAAGVVTLSFTELGPLSLQMAQHLLVMNVLAPLAAAAQARRSRTPGGIALWLAGGAQLLLLYAWHSPSLQQAASASITLHAALLLVLAIAALLFWSALLRAGSAGHWRALAALLLTGKLACLLGALLIFAPRDLYRLQGFALPFCTTGPSTLADQQLAGLLMVTACPLSYLVAGVVLAARMLMEAETAADLAARPASR